MRRAQPLLSAERRHTLPTPHLFGISLRHFVHAVLLRFRYVIAQLRYATTSFRKMRFTYRSGSFLGGVCVGSLQRIGHSLETLSQPAHLSLIHEKRYNQPCNRNWTKQEGLNSP
jgi:hypothetical protein